MCNLIGTCKIKRIRSAKKQYTPLCRSWLLTNLTTIGEMAQKLTRFHLPMGLQECGKKRCCHQSCNQQHTVCSGENVECFARKQYVSYIGENVVDVGSDSQKRFLLTRTKSFSARRGQSQEGLFILFLARVVRRQRCGPLTSE